MLCTMHNAHSTPTLCKMMHDPFCAQCTMHNPPPFCCAPTAAPSEPAPPPAVLQGITRNVIERLGCLKAILAIDESVILLKLSLSPSLLMHLLKVEGGAAE